MPKSEAIGYDQTKQSVHDNGWGMFTRFLAYKLKDQGKQLVKIDKWFPSTKKCSCCGAEKPMELKVEKPPLQATCKGGKWWE